MPAQPPTTLAELRRYAIRRTLFTPGTLARAVERLGYVQADPIRSPARAQDLILRPRVRGYRAGDLERRYTRLAVEEDFFVNYGFVSRGLHALMHPRERGVSRPAAQRRRTAELLAFVREHGTVHPRDVDRHFAHGRVTNYWGGTSSATTHLLDDMHYRGLLRIAGRENGIRLYAAREPHVQTQPRAERARCSPDRAERQREAQENSDALVDAIVHLYAPLPQATLTWLVARLRYAAPQWHARLPATLRRAKERLGQATIDGVRWYWPANESASGGRGRPVAGVRLLAPFDPLVWDRRRFEQFWGWAYRFEAYTPKAKRKLGYYALPLLWHEDIIGWANLSVQDDALVPALGFVRGMPDDPAFARALDEELDAVRVFLGLAHHHTPRT